MIKYVDGNLIKMANEGKFDVIAHGCNCKSIMGAGIALQIKNNFPEAYKVDSAITDSGSKLGKFSSVYVKTKADTPLLVINVYTQYDLGKDFNLGAFNKCMSLLDHFLDKNLKIGIPKIGCGMGGGKWKIVESQLERIFKNRDITVVNFKR